MDVSVFCCYNPNGSLMRLVLHAVRHMLLCPSAALEAMSMSRGQFASLALIPTPAQHW